MPRQPYRPPRDWLDAPHKGVFGAAPVSRLTWHSPETELDQALLAAAKLQSDIAYRVRIRNTQMTTPGVAAFADLHVDTVRDILNGSKHANLAVLQALLRSVGLDYSVTYKALGAPPESPTA